MSTAKSDPAQLVPAPGHSPEWAQLEKIIRQVLREHGDLLQHWRRQTPTLGDRVKNFENWLLVELVHAVFTLGATQVKTNGYLPDWRPSFEKYENRTSRFQELQHYLCSLGLKGRKLTVGSLSPDLSVLLPGADAPANLEIKTQTGIQDVLMDLGIVQYHNEHERRPAYQAGFLWVVLEPQEQPHRQRVRQSVAKIQDRAKTLLGVFLKVEHVPGAPGLRYALAVPPATRP